MTPQHSSNSEHNLAHVSAADNGYSLIATSSSPYETLTWNEKRIISVSSNMFFTCLSVKCLHELLIKGYYANSTLCLHVLLIKRHYANSPFLFNRKTPQKTRDLLMGQKWANLINFLSLILNLSFNFTQPTKQLKITFPF